MADRANCFITSSIEGKGAYAVRRDNDQNVYIPVGVADALGLEEFEEVVAILVANDRIDPPWRAIRVKRSDEAG